jgi:hypothetical protein
MLRTLLVADGARHPATSIDETLLFENHMNPDRPGNRMINSVPWDSTVAICVKRQGCNEYTPEVIGLSLNEALEYALVSHIPRHLKLHIWVEWGSQKVSIDRRSIFKLARRRDRPSLSEDSFTKIKKIRRI